ncbi:MAG: PQQ-binding-like beta-propeller repeat protein [Planctomycetota bacterium]
MPTWKLALLMLSLVPAVSFAENWPCWRGPRGDGSSVEANVPWKWDATKNEGVAWKVAVPYGGHSSPVVWGDRIFITGADEANPRRMLMAFDRTSGKLLWEQEVAKTPLEKKHKLNSWASGTPATDGTLVYAAFLDEKEMLVSAYDLNGNEKWTVRPGVFSSVHGYCSCPVLFEKTVIVNGDHDGEAYLVALDRETGKTIWKTPRENKTRSYCTPIIRDIDGRTQMILSGSKCVASYDPRTGQRHWILDGPTEQFVASPVENKGLIFITGGFPDKHILAIDPRGSGQITEESHVKWHHLNKGVSYVPSPVAANDYFYCVADGGIGGCYDAVTGEIQWQERLGRHHSGSLVAAAGRVYFLDDDGITHVLEVGPEFKVLATNPLGEEAYSSPAISQGQMFIRGETHLFCIGDRRAKTAAK